MGDLYPAPPGQVAVKVELLLQLQSLVAGVGLSAPAAAVAKWTCNKKRIHKLIIKKVDLTLFRQLKPHYNFFFVMCLGENTTKLRYF